VEGPVQPVTQAVGSGPSSFMKVKFSITAKFRLGERAENTKEKSRQVFMAPKCMVGMTLNFFFIEFLNHVMSVLTQKPLKRSGTHGLNIKWNLRHGPAWLIYRRLAWSVGLCECCAHLAIWKLSFLESGKFGPFFSWKILCIG